MNDWNYAKKGGKIGLIYGMTFSLYLILGSFLTPLMVTDVGGGLYEYKFLLDLILLLPVLPAAFLPHLVNLIFFEFSLGGAITGFFFGSILDIIKENHKGETEKSQREKGVFIRIPFGSRKTVISEKMVNCFIFAEFLILVFFVGIIFSGDIYDNSGLEHQNEIDGVEGKYVRYTDGITIYFNKSTYTFTEYYPNGEIENGTYIVNETLLKLYYFNGTTKEYIIKNVNQLNPANSSEGDWHENWYR